jgi:2-methylcitrate dehydratase PrpD
MITARLADYIAASDTRTLPPEVVEAAQLHLIDTVAAMVSGSTLAARAAAKAFVAELSGSSADCTIVGLNLRASADCAALANGMFAHADESDDSHGASVTHPGCSTIPAALAAAEVTGASGDRFLRAIVTGYDVGPRVAAALGGGRFMEHYHHVSFGGIFGAAAASAAVMGLDSAAAARAIAFATHLAGGNTCWMRDPAHVEKGLVFAGFPAQNGLRAALMGRSGIPTSTEPLEGVPGLFAGYPEAAEPALAIEALGERFEVMRTAIKKWCVGSPCQAALDVMEDLVRNTGVRAADVMDIHVTLPARRVQITRSPVPNLNLSHLMALFLVDGGVDFASVHDHARMEDSAVLALRRLVRIEERPGAGRREHAVVTVTLRDGRSFHAAPQTVRGQPDNPMTRAEVVAKAQSLMASVLGDRKSALLIAALEDIAKAPNLSHLRALLQP